MQCLREAGKPADEATSVELRDDGLYKITCPHGHVTLTALQQQKFEVLFDLGAMALLDGYPREAVSSIAASLERFFEFYVQVVSLKRGISIDEFRTAWEPLSRRSEGQFGAFLLVYLIENGRPLQPVISDVKPKILGQKTPSLSWAAFRNNVIHKGYIPSSDEVILYGDLIYKFINQLIEELRVNCAEAIHKATFSHIHRAVKHADGKPIVTMGIPTLISLARGDKPASNLKDALTEISKYKRWLYH
jgi:hypothetical protein